MLENVIHNGVILEFKAIGLNELNRVAQIFNRTRVEAQAMAREVPEGIYTAFAPLASLRSLLNRDLRNPMQRVSDELDENFQNLTYSLRTLRKGYYDFIMGGVAIAMSGLGLKRVGEGILRSINTWIDASMEFNMVMKQIQVLGQVTGEEYEKLRKRVIQVGVDLPVSNLEAAQAALMALKTGFTAEETYYLTEYVSKMMFLSEGTLDAAEATRFFNAIIKQTDYTAQDAGIILDKLAKTMQITAFDMGEIWQTWKSSRAAFGNLRSDFDSFLTLLGMARTALNPRYAGMMVSQWSSAVLAAFSSTGKRGELWNLLGIDLEKIGKDPLEVLKQVSEKSRALWGEDTALRMAKLANIFGRAAVPMIQYYENYMKRSAMSAEDMRKEIEKSEGFSAKLLSNIMSTFWGLREIVTGTKETLWQMLGDIFEPVVKPALITLQQLIATLINIIEAHPGIAKALGYGTGLAGLLATVGGTAMIAGGQFMAMTGSILHAVLQLGIMGRSTQELNTRVKTGAVRIIDLLKEMVWGTREQAGLFRILGRNMLRFTLISGIMYLAWRYDFLRIRTIMTEFFTNLQKSISTADKQLKTLRPERLHSYMEELSKGDSRWDRFTATLMRGKLIMDALNEAIDNYRKTGTFRLTNKMMAALVGKSEEEVAAMTEIDERASRFLETLGDILDFIEAWSRFWHGFIQGAQDAYKVLDTLILRPLRWIWDTFWDIAEWFGKVFNIDVKRPDLNKWEAIGRVLGFIVASVVAVKLALFSWEITLGGIVKLIDKIVRIGRGGGGAAGGAAAGGAAATAAETAATAAAATGAAGAASGAARGAARIRAQIMNALSRISPVRAARNVITDVALARAAVKAGQIPTARSWLGRLLYGSAKDYAHYHVAGQVPRVTSVKYGVPADLDKRLGVYIANKGLIGRISSWLFGSRAYLKTGEYVGRTSGVFARFASYLDDVFLRNKPGAIPSVLRGLNSIGKYMSTLDKVLVTLTTTIEMIRAPKGEKLRAGITNVGAWAGVIGGGKLGAAIGSFILPGIGTIIGTILGGAIGQLAGSKVGEAFANWLYKVIEGLKNHPVRKVWSQRIAEYLRGGPAQPAYSYAELRAGTVPRATGYQARVDAYQLNTIQRERYISAQVKRYGAGYYSRHAEGGIFTKPHIGLLAEEGPEAVIPLDEKYRRRALGLWHGVGEIIATPKESRVAPPIPFETPKRISVTAAPVMSTIPRGLHSQTVSNNTQVIFKEGAIVVSVQSLSSPADIRKGAEQLFQEFKKLIEKEHMRNYNKVRVR